MAETARARSALQPFYPRAITTTFTQNEKTDVKAHIKYLSQLIDKYETKFNQLSTLIDINEQRTKKGKELLQATPELEDWLNGVDRSTALLCDAACRNQCSNSTSSSSTSKSPIGRCHCIAKLRHCSPLCHRTAADIGQIRCQSAGDESWILLWKAVRMVDIHFNKWTRSRDEPTETSPITIDDANAFTLAKYRTSSHTVTPAHFDELKSPPLFPFFVSLADADDGTVSFSDFERSAKLKRILDLGAFLTRLWDSCTLMTSRAELLMASDSTQENWMANAEPRIRHVQQFAQDAQPLHALWVLSIGKSTACACQGARMTCTGYADCPCAAEQRMCHPKCHEKSLTGAAAAQSDLIGAAQHGAAYVLLVQQWNQVVPHQVEIDTVLKECNDVLKKISELRQSAAALPLTLPPAAVAAESHHDDIIDVLLANLKKFTKSPLYPINLGQKELIFEKSPILALLLKTDPALTAFMQGKFRLVQDNLARLMHHSEELTDEHMGFLRHVQALHQAWLSALGNATIEKCTCDHPAAPPRNDPTYFPSCIDIKGHNQCTCASKNAFCHPFCHSNSQRRNFGEHGPNFAKLVAAYRRVTSGMHKISDILKECEDYRTTRAELMRFGVAVPHNLPKPPLAVHPPRRPAPPPAEPLAARKAVVGAAAVTVSESDSGDAAAQSAPAAAELLGDDDAPADDDHSNSGKKDSDMLIENLPQSIFKIDGLPHDGTKQEQKVPPTSIEVKVHAKADSPAGKIQNVAGRPIALHFHIGTTVTTNTVSVPTLRYTGTLTRPGSKPIHVAAFCKSFFSQQLTRFDSGLHHHAITHTRPTHIADADAAEKCWVPSSSQHLLQAESFVWLRVRLWIEDSELAAVTKDSAVQLEVDEKGQFNAAALSVVPCIGQVDFKVSAAEHESDAVHALVAARTRVPTGSTNWSEKREIREFVHGITSNDLQILKEQVEKKVREYSAWVEGGREKVSSKSVKKTLKGKRRTYHTFDEAILWIHASEQLISQHKIMLAEAASFLGVSTNSLVKYRLWHMFLACGLSSDFSGEAADEIFLTLGSQTVSAKKFGRLMVGRYVSWEEFREDMLHHRDRRIVPHELMRSVEKAPLDNVTWEQFKKVFDITAAKPESTAAAASAAPAELMAVEKEEAADAGAAAAAAEEEALPEESKATEAAVAEEEAEGEEAEDTDSEEESASVDISDVVLSP